MVDRLDIDALLIGSLYGELNAADEARLQAHLESHPGDRAALAGLTRARELLLESHFLKVQLEPPQAISALLLHQAAHHAPKVKAVAVEPEREGWFARFVRSFVGHPAMAAAAMLVLVLGVAGALYMRKGDHFAEPTTTTSSPTASQPQPQLAQEKRREVSADKPTTTDSYQAELGPPASQPPADKDKDSKKYGGGATAMPDHMVPSQRVLEAKTSPGPTPKELEDEKLDKNANEKQVAKVDSAETKRNEAPAMAPTGRSQNTDADAAVAAEKEVRNRIPPGNPAPTVVPPRVATTPSAGSGSATIARSDEQTETLAWAKQQHQKLATETQRNQCEAAAATAVALSLRAPGYYQQNVETDRTLKPCTAYINRARELDATRNARKREPSEAIPAPAPTKAASPSSDKR